jgi:WD40 repeat protein
VAILLALAVSTTMYIRAQRAQTNEAQLRRQAQAQAYASDISLAQQALAMDDLGRARRLLEAHRPAPGEVDLRGWEWRYLWQECQSDALGELCRYPSQVRSVAYSPDGNVLAVAGSVQEFVDIWDVPGRRRIATLQPKEGHLVAFSPRGDLLATTAGNQIRLWRTGTWDLVEPPLTLPAYVEVFRFSPDGKQLASLSYPDEVTVWKVDNWDVVRRIRGVRLGLLLGTLDFSPDGKALVIGGADGRLQVVDLASGNLNFDIPKAHPESITAVAWSPNGSIIASGSGWLGGPIRLWDAATGNNLGKLEGHTSWICELIFSLSPDGLRLYSAGGDQTIRIWDVGQGQCLATLRGSSDVVQGLARSPDGTTLASVCKDGVVAFWNALPRPEEEQPRLIPLGRGISLWPAFAPSSQVLAAPREGTVSLFDLATSKEIEPIPKLGDDVSTVAYSPDGTLLVSGSRRGRIRVWSCAERRALGELDGHKEPIVRLYFRADGTRLLSVDRKGNAIWWDALTWQPGRTFMVEFVWAWPGDVSPDDHLLAAAAMGAMRWLNAETGELLATTTGGHQGIPDGAAFSDDGSQVASVSPDGTVALWDPSSFRLITVFRGHMLGAHGVAFSPDGRRLATGSNGRDAVRLWDLSTHRELMTLSGQGSQFWFVAFSPDGRWLAACGREGRLHLWRAPSWEEIEAAENRTARIWDVATPDQVATR